jgi:hypothetical protein
VTCLPYIERSLGKSREPTTLLRQVQVRQRRFSQISHRNTRIDYCQRRFRGSHIHAAFPFEATTS